MRQHKIREAVWAKYTPSAPKVSTSRYVPTKNKGSTLQEFYDEVHAKNLLHQEHFYQNKNAQEIETIMAQNRRLIDAKRAPRR
ncbi:MULTISPECIES: hypothetical protein [unclassified Sulfuricurvum]|uniref:hypothetical protein n=1 Tax=unclassified Sulfuricurvum TaxID=2632390 RepID=UPI0002996A7D|nr:MULTISPECIES: hypothetical protein [unclassified Sulfuricurvum]AFV97253.1 hypothetical protein B649_04695 [Candidatus Sulfuricurvum sp. RIFRC-1]OHD84457.1 MAG: hypothetical protein A2Y52_05995 [Sulfuricurvum sp. RIFCSPLOWO2_02_43_6]OHD85740.1 MAG: hypothetical protein A3I60_03600 [Sulfuricurvum sp. RIFCSPLOWO2_02_FULL_43_45]HBM34902.1 hypothetical protein [Sulfuricurvum sp.]